MRGVLAIALLVGCSNAPKPQAWPAGDYCVLRDGGSCPQATNGTFAKGQIVIDTDNGITFQREHGASQQLNDSNHDGLLSLEVCCGSFTEAGEAFPNEPFVVLAGASASGYACPTGFTPGNVYIDAEDAEVFGDNADSYVTGNVGASGIAGNRNVNLVVCESPVDLTGVDMPDASYCVFAGRTGCPTGFSTGSITTYDESSGNTDAIMGTVGGITQGGASTNFPICCY